MQEILTAIQGIDTAIAGKSFADFRREWLGHPEIPWEQVKGIGSVLRHEYHRISDKVIWTVVLERLPSLKLAIEKMQVSLKE